MGASVVNAHSPLLSKLKFTATGKSYTQEYKRGISTGPVKAIGKANDTGTIVTFSPDLEIFKEGISLNFDTVKKNKCATAQISLPPGVSPD